MTSRKSTPHASFGRNPGESPATRRRQAAAAAAAAARAASSISPVNSFSQGSNDRSSGGSSNNNNNNAARRTSPSPDHDLLAKFMKRDQEQQRHNNTSALLIKSTSSTTMLTTETKASTITMPMSNTSTPAARQRRLLNEASWTQKPDPDQNGATTSKQRGASDAGGDGEASASLTTNQTIDSSNGSRSDHNMFEGWARQQEQARDMPPFPSPKAVTEEQRDALPTDEKALKKHKKKKEKSTREKMSKKSKSKKNKKKQAKLSESAHETNHGSSQELDPFDPASSAQWGSSANTFGTARTSSHMTSSSGVISSAQFSPHSPNTQNQQQLGEQFEHFMRLDQMEANMKVATKQLQQQKSASRKEAPDSQPPPLLHSEPASRSWRANKKEQRMIANLPPARTTAKAPASGSASVTSDIDSIAEPPSVDERNTPGYMASKNHEKAWTTSQKNLAEHQRPLHNQAHPASPDDFLGMDSSHSKANSTASKATTTSMSIMEPPSSDERAVPTFVTQIPNRNHRPNGKIDNTPNLSLTAASTTEEQQAIQAKKKRDEQMWRQIAQSTTDQMAADASVASGSIMEPPSVEERFTPQAMVTPEPPDKVLTASSRRNLSNSETVRPASASLPRGAQEHYERRKMDKTGLASQQQRQKRGAPQAFTARLRQSAPGRYSSKQQLRASPVQQFNSERRRTTLRNIRKSHQVVSANSYFEQNTPNHQEPESPPISSPTDHRYSQTTARINPDGSETWRSTPPQDVSAASGRNVGEELRGGHDSRGSDGYNEPSYVSQHHRHRAEQRKGSKLDSPSTNHVDDELVEQLDDSMNLEDVFPDASFTASLRSSTNTQQVASDPSLNPVGAVAYTGRGFRDEVRSVESSEDGTKSAVSVQPVLQANRVGSNRDVVQGNVLFNLDHEKDREDKLFYRRYCRIVIAFVCLGIVVGIVVPVVVKPKSKDAPTREPLSPAPSEAPSVSSFPTSAPTQSPTGIAWENFLEKAGSAGQELGSAVSFAGDVLAVGSAGGSGLLEIFQVNRETQQLELLGAPLDIDSEIPHDATVKIGAKGDLVAVAIPSESDSSIGRVEVYRRDNEGNWFLNAQINGTDASFGTSMDLSGNGARLVVASNTIAQAYDLTAAQPLQLGNNLPLLRGTGFPTFVSISESLLGIGQVRPGRVGPCIGEGCNDRALVGLYQYDGTDWIDAPSSFSGPNTLSDSGPFHDLGSDQSVLALTDTRDAVRVFKFNPSFASFIRVGNAIPLGRVLGVQETVYLDLLGDSHVAVAWDRKAVVYDLVGDTWVQRGQMILLEPDVTPVVALSGDGQLLVVGLDEAGISKSGRVRILRLASL